MFGEKLTTDMLIEVDVFGFDHVVGTGGLSAVGREDTPVLVHAIHPELKRQALKFPHVDAHVLASVYILIIQNLVVITINGCFGEMVPATHLVNHQLTVVAVEAELTVAGIAIEFPHTGAAMLTGVASTVILLTCAKENNSG